MDLRWAGEPDVVLHLTKLGGASLGLSDVQLAGMIRFVFSPITEDPPFLRRVAISLLEKPYIDFSVRALGGPDLMALPTLSSWLRSVVTTLAEKRIVFPKEVGITWARVGPPDHEDIQAMDSALSPPLGVLAVRVVSATIEPRRSTFLGRLKLPNPRISLLLPDEEHEKDKSVLQAGITDPREKTLQPRWEKQFLFVVVKQNQRLCVLLSHKRMDLLGADMPLGMIQIPLQEVLDDSILESQERMVSAKISGVEDLHGQHCSLEIENLKQKTQRTIEDTHLVNRLDRLPLEIMDNDDDYASAHSSPRNSIKSNGSQARGTNRDSIPESFLWASPSSSLEQVFGTQRRSPSMVRTRGRDWLSTGHSSHAIHHLHQKSPIEERPEFGQSGLSQSKDEEDMGSMDEMIRNDEVNMELLRKKIENSPSLAQYQTPGENLSVGLGILVDSSSKVQNMEDLAMASSKQGHFSSSYDSSHWHPPRQNIAESSSIISGKWSESRVQTLDTYFSSCSGTNGITSAMDLDDSSASKKDANSGAWLSPAGVQVDLLASGAVTMAGMVSQAMKIQRKEQDMTSMKDPDEKKSWLSSLQSFVLGGQDYDDYYDDDDGHDLSGAGSAVGRIRIHLQWMPVMSSVQPKIDKGTESIPNRSGTGEGLELENPSPFDVNKKKKSLPRRQGKKRAKSEQGLQSSFQEQHIDHGSDSSNPQRGSFDAQTRNRQSRGSVLENKCNGISPSQSSEFADDALGSCDASPRPDSGINAVLHGVQPSATDFPRNAGILAVYVSYTKLDYGDTPSNPVLALSIRSADVISAGVASADADALLEPRRRVMTMESEAGGRPGLLHWNRVFHLVVWNASGSRARLELGDATSSLKLSSYGPQLYTLDACRAFESVVTVDATATIPLKDVRTRGIVRGTWRLREASKGGRGAMSRDSERLDVGRVALVMAWHPFAGVDSSFLG